MTPPKSHKAKRTCSSTYVVTLECGHKALVTNPEATSFNCFVCSVVSGAAVNVKPLVLEKFQKWIQPKEEEEETQ